MSRFTPHDICAWAGRQTVGGAKRKAVLNALALFADRLTWECWPSYATLAQYTEIAERSVSRAVSELEGDGFISRERIRRADGSLAGWRFKLNPLGVETVIPGRPAQTGDEAEAASATADDIAPDDVAAPENASEGDPDFEGERPVSPINQPVANLATGDQLVGEQGRNEPQDVDFSQSPNQPGGEITTVVKQESPVANGGGSLTTTGTTTSSPLPPSVAAACLPDGQAAATEADRFRKAILAAYGAAVFTAWFDDLLVEEAVRAGPDPGEIIVRLATGSASRRDRIDQQHRPALERIWKAVNAPSAASVRIRVEVSPLLAAAAAARREARAAEGSASQGTGSAPRRRRRA